MLVKAVVLLDVEDVTDWQRAYAVAFGLSGSGGIYGRKGSARISEVQSVEAFVLPPCVVCKEPIKEGYAWERQKQTGEIGHSGCVWSADQ